MSKLNTDMRTHRLMTADGPRFRTRSNLTPMRMYLNSTTHHTRTHILSLSLSLSLPTHTHTRVIRIRTTYMYSWTTPVITCQVLLVPRTHNDTIDVCAVSWRWIAPRVCQCINGRTVHGCLGLNGIWWWSVYQWHNPGVHVWMHGSALYQPVFNRLSCVNRRISTSTKIVLR